MVVKGFDGYSGSLGFWGVLSFLYFSFVVVGLFGWCSGLFGVDGVRFYLGVLSVFLV